MANKRNSTDAQKHLNGEHKQIEDPNRIRINWYMTMTMAILNLGGLYGAYLAFTSANPRTFIFALFYGYLGMLGFTAGVHRMWCHKSYKAKFLLKVILCILWCISQQKSILVWSKEHRMHHKYTDTNADPYSIKRGFFFAHIGWLLCRHHPEYKAKMNSIPLNDLLADPIVRLESRFQIPMRTLISLLLPVLICVWCWNESIWDAVFVSSILRVCIFHQFVYMINSVAHTFGSQPYKKGISARDNMLTASVACGEGWHNYHHAFQWDYASSELGAPFDSAKIFIEFMAKIGLAYDLKTMSPEALESKKLKCKINSNSQSEM